MAIFVAWGIHAGLDWIWEMPGRDGVGLRAGGDRVRLPRSHAGCPPRPAAPPGVAIGLGCLVLAVIPFQVAASERALHQSVRAFGSTRATARGRSTARSRRSRRSARGRSPGRSSPTATSAPARARLAVEAALNAVRRDPENWTYRYTLALVQGVAGDDPRPAARRALALNPRSVLAEDAVEKFGKAKRSDWPAVARTLQLPAS